VITRSNVAGRFSTSTELLSNDAKQYTIEWCIGISLVRYHRYNELVNVYNLLHTISTLDLPPTSSAGVENQTIGNSYKIGQMKGVYNDISCI